MSAIAADFSVMDALETKNRLVKAGVPPAQAEAQARIGEEQARAVAQATSREEIAKHAAGKTEFADLAARVNEVDKKVAVINAKLTMLTWIVGVNTVAVLGAAMKIIFG